MGYTKKEVFEITGLPLRLVQYHTERGLVSPEIDPGEGRGGIRKYSKRNLVEFGVIKVLNEYRMSFGRIKTILNLLQYASPVIYKDGTVIDIKFHLLEAGVDFDSRSYIERWDEITEDSYLIICVMPDKSLMPNLLLGPSWWKFMKSPYIGMAESTLIINFKQIIDVVRKA